MRNKNDRALHYLFLFIGALLAFAVVLLVILLLTEPEALGLTK